MDVYEVRFRCHSADFGYEERRIVTAKSADLAIIKANKKLTKDWGQHKSRWVAICIGAFRLAVLD